MLTKSKLLRFKNLLYEILPNGSKLEIDFVKGKDMWFKKRIIKN